METPASQGYRWPAEWEPHRATWLSWPHNRETWPDALDVVRASFAAMVAALAPREAVEIGVADDAMEETARAAIRRAGWDPDRNVRFHRWPTTDAWCRDHGPIFVVRKRSRRSAGRGARSPQGAQGAAQRAAGERSSSGRQASEVHQDAGEPATKAILDFRFDNWGRKYPGWELDDAVPRHVEKALGLPRFASEMVLEGGGIDGDGQGTVLTTESCLLHPNRGPGRTRERMERLLADFLGARRVLWLGEGIAGDDTDGHVDDIARFVAPGVVVAATCDDPADANAAPLAENLRRLRAMSDARGAALQIVELPMPPRLEQAGQRSPASHANFYLANGVALVPVFGHGSDARALAILRELLPGRDVVGIPSAELVSGFGAVHCVTQQEPAGEAP
ncbi:MAG TPA: agmatine deiminase family protein [Myxococcota bacterium]|nr:agmatine deiminase family protein [Myxococcota bacterium]